MYGIVSLKIQLLCQTIAFDEHRNSWQKNHAIVYVLILRLNEILGEKKDQ